MLVATQSYKPLSAGLKFLMVSVPWLTSVLPAGKGNTDRLQVITGRGYPSAWHFAWNVVPCAGEASEGGTVVKIGRPDMEIVIERKQNQGGSVAEWSACWSRKFESRSGHLLDLFSVAPSSKSSATLVNSQLVASCQLGSVMLCLNYLCLCMWVQNACKLAG